MPPSTFSTSLKDRPLPPLQTPSQPWSLGYLFQRLAEMCQYELWNHAAERIECTDYTGQEYHECIECTDYVGGEHSKWIQVHRLFCRECAEIEVRNQPSYGSVLSGVAEEVKGNRSISTLLLVQPKKVPYVSSTPLQFLWETARRFTFPWLGNVRRRARPLPKVL